MQGLTFDPARVSLLRPVEVKSGEIMSSGISEDVFGHTEDGRLVQRYTLSNSQQMKVQVITLGGAITHLCVPDKNGQIDDVVLGYDTVEGYVNDIPYFGALIGRFANRIAKGHFELDGKEYTLKCNNPPNHLHGGVEGAFNKEIWNGEIDNGKVHLTHTSPDGTAGYPGEVTVHVTYELTNENELHITYTATTTKATPLNLTNHSYFNLAGHKHENVYGHLITTFADKFAPKDETNIPTGELASVTGTAFDMRKPTLLGSQILFVPKCGDEMPGFDHSFDLEHDRVYKLAARAEDEKSGRVMECFTDLPAFQLYTANYLKDVKGKDGAIYGQHGAFCIETQFHPDSPNKPNFPSCILQPGQTFKSTTTYKFSVKH